MGFKFAIIYVHYIDIAHILQHNIYKRIHILK